MSLIKLRLAGLIALAALCQGCPGPNTPYGGYSPIKFLGITIGYSSPDMSKIPSINPITRGFPLAFEASWSPDGRQLALLAFTYSTSNLPLRVYLLDAASGQIQTDWEVRNPAVVFSEEGYWDPLPALNWASDGSLKLIQQGGQTGMLERLYIHTLRTGASAETSVLYLPQSIKETEFTSYSHPALSPDQRQLAVYEHTISTATSTNSSYGTGYGGAYYQTVDKLQLTIYDLQTHTRRKAGPVLESGGYQVNRPVWSPDQSAVYVSLATPLPANMPPDSSISSSRTELFRISLSDGKLEKLWSPEQATIQSLRVSPDGKRLLLDLASNPIRDLPALQAKSKAPLSLIPAGGKLDYGANLIQLEPSSGQIDYFSSELNLSGTPSWHDNHLALMKVITYSQMPPVWRFWNAQTRSLQAELSPPDSGGLTLGAPLGLSPAPARQMALSLYTPCCTLDKLRTGVYLWDLDRKSLKRVGPDIARLMKDFPGVGLHERPQYDFSQVNKDIPTPTPYPYPYPNPYGSKP